MNEQLTIADVFHNIRYVEIDEVAVDKDLWNRVKHGDKGAIKQLKAEQNENVYLYSHGLCVRDNDIIITLRELDKFVAGLGVKIEYEEDRF